MVPILTVRETAPVVAFYARLGLHVTAEFDGYVILATDAVRADDAVEVHLSQWDDHDPRTTANMVYLRVRDADAVYRAAARRARPRRGASTWPPPPGSLAALTAELRAREDAGEAAHAAARDRGQAVGPARVRRDRPRRHGSCGSAHGRRSDRTTAHLPRRQLARAAHARAPPTRSRSLVRAVGRRAHRRLERGLVGPAGHGRRAHRAAHRRGTGPGGGGGQHDRDVVQGGGRRAPTAPRPHDDRHPGAAASRPTATPSTPSGPRSSPSAPTSWPTHSAPTRPCWPSPTSTTAPVAASTWPR